MRSADDLLQELNAADECPGIEAKKSREAGKSLLETVCAFSNEPGLGGGYLLLGVEWVVNLLGDRVYRPSGLPDPDKVQADLATQCASVFNQVIRPEMSLERVEGQPVLVVYIPEVPAAAKPVFLPATGLPRGAFRRIGSTDQRCTEEDIWALRGLDSPSESYDAVAIPDAGLDDVDPTAVAEYRRLRAQVNASAEELALPEEELLASLGATRVWSGQERLTLAGLLLFGKPVALRRLLPATRVDYIRVLGTEWMEDPERRFQSLDIRKALLLAIRQAEAAIEDDLPKGFHLPEGALQSIQEPVLPRKVIRETLANALMHRNYRINEPIQIIRYSNRIEVLNPGYSLKRTNELGQPGSRQRNPLVAAVFHELNLAETKGTGIRTIRRLLEYVGMAPPEFQSDRERERFRAVLHLHHLFTEEDVVWLRSLSPEPLSADAGKVLLFLREAEAVDNGTCRELTGLDTLQASALLRRLRDQSLLEKEGSGNRTYYVPGPGLLKVESPGLRGASPSPNPPQVIENPPQVIENPPQVEENPPQLRVHGFPQTLLDRLPKPGKKPSQSTIRSLILELCQWEPQTARDLARLLGDRDPKELVKNYLGPMLAAKELEHTIRDMPNHPKQQYAVRRPGK